MSSWRKMFATSAFLLLVISSEISPTLGGRPPKLIKTPSDSVVPHKEAVTLNCEADGDPTPQISWMKDGKPLRLASQGLRNFLPTGGLFFLRVRKDDAGVYACVATNTFGEVMSRNATLDVATLQTEYKVSPQNAWVAQGDNVVLECDPPKGNPEPKVSWKKNGNPIDIKANGRFKLVGTGSLSISQVRQSDEGRYSCLAKNIVGNRQSSPALLRVTIRPEFTIRPANTSALLGGEVSLSCVARGDPPPEITWRKEGGQLPFKRVHFDEERFLLSNVSESDTGVYTCVAENKAGSINSSAIVNVLPLPLLTMTPNDVEVQPNSTAFFGCEAIGDPPPTLFWIKEGGHNLVFQGSRQDKTQVTPQGTLQIDNVSERDEGHYFCAAVSLAGSVIHRVHLKVTPMEELPPPIVSNGPFNQTRPFGSVAVLPCIANGNPPPVITWYKDGESFLLGHRVFTDDAGTLRINDLEPSDTGIYECVASSRSGKYAWRSQLTVLSLEESSFQSKLLSNGFDPIKRPAAPEKPYVTKVDSSSITIAWHPHDHSIPEESPKPQQSPIPIPRKLPFPPLTFGEDKSRSGSDRDSSPTYIDDISLGANADNEEEEEDDYVSEESSEPSRFSERRKRSEEANAYISNKPAHKYSDADTFFKSLDSNRFKFQQIGHGEDKEQSGEDANAEEEESTFHSIVKSEESEDEYDYTDGDDYEEEAEGENLVLTSTSTSTTTTTTSTTTTTTSTPKPTRRTFSLVNPREYVNPKPVSFEPTITYRVEYYSPGETKTEWLLGGTNINEQTFTFNHLKPNMDYSFFVRAISPEGVLSGPSPISDAVRTLPAGSKSTEMEAVWTEARRKLSERIVVILKNVYATSSTSVRIEWQIVSASDYVEGFYIYYRKVLELSPELGETEGNGNSHQMLTVLNAGASTFQIVGLDKYATYQVFLVPFYKNVEGRPSNYVNVSTLQDVPTAAPELTEPKLVNGSALLVGWKPPPAAHHNGVILGYQLRVWQGSALIGNKTVESTTTSIILNNLSPGQTYSLQIGSFTAKGIGIFSPMKAVTFSPPLESLPPGSPDDSNKIDRTPVEIPDNEGEDNRVPILPRFPEDGIPFGGAAVNAKDDVLSEAWFIALIGSVIFAMMLVFVFALYLRRCQIRAEGDKLKVSTTEIPDGSIPPHYSAEESLWIEQKQQLTLKSAHGMGMSLGVKPCGENEYENANNYAVVEDRHSPIAYATTTLVNNNPQKHNKSSFSVFGGDSLNSKGGLVREFVGGYNKMGGGWASGNHPSKTASLNMSSQEMKKPSWLLNASPANNVGSSIVVFGANPNGGANGPCSSTQSSSSHSSASSEALMKHNKGSTKLSLKSNSGDSNGKIGKRRGTGSRPSSRGQGREDDDEHNQYMDMDDPEYFADEFKSSINMGGHVLTTFQTPLPSRKHLIVDYSSGSPVTSSANNHSLQQRLNEYEQYRQLQQQQQEQGNLPQYAHPSHLRNHHHGHLF